LRISYGKDAPMACVTKRTPKPRSTPYTTTLIQKSAARRRGSAASECHTSAARIAAEGRARISRREFMCASPTLSTAKGQGSPLEELCHK
jgi:hypothetical protein